MLTLGLIALIVPLLAAAQLPLATGRPLVPGVVRANRDLPPPAPGKHHATSSARRVDDRIRCQVRRVNSEQYPRTLSQSGAHSSRVRSTQAPREWRCQQPKRTAPRSYPPGRPAKAVPLPSSNGNCLSAVGNGDLAIPEQVGALITRSRSCRALYIHCYEHWSRSRMAAWALNDQIRSSNP
jgi:hypothetical protein